MAGEQPANLSPGYSLGFSPPVLGLADIPGGVAPWSLGQHHQVVSVTPTPGALAPVPQACEIPVLSGPHEFQVPVKQITSVADVKAFVDGESGSLLLGFIVSLCESIKGKKLSDECHVSDACHRIISVLQTLNSWVDEIPPQKTVMRYGNPSFRQWQERLQERGPSLVRSILPEGLKEAEIETFPYFADSFGNISRIDYGTGHEANFAAWLLCHVRLGIIKPEDYQALVSRVFVNYLSLMRKLQTTYWLEPAGSHGVWGLDDYHFLPFIFGSSQLIGHKYMKPKSILNDDILETFSSEYLYLSSVAFVKKVKKGPFSEHSPMLNDICAVPNWNKVNSGLLKMYRAELMEKVPIMQHFLFGYILPWSESNIEHSRSHM